MKFYLTTALLFLLLQGYAQQLSQVTFTQLSDFTCFSLSTSQNILIKISADGRILESGTEQASNYNRNYFASKLLPYTGAINYYQHEPDSTLNGRIKISALVMLLIMVQTITRKEQANLNLLAAFHLIITESMKMPCLQEELKTSATF